VRYNVQQYTGFQKKHRQLEPAEVEPVSNGNPAEKLRMLHDELLALWTAQ
jgi:hypothetical protein